MAILNNALLINQTSSEVEYYTPPEIIEAAREVLGEIDLDPASSQKANCIVKAKHYYGFGLDDNFIDGMSQEWHGRVWLNHPFSRRESACGEFCAKKHLHHKIDFHGNKAWIDKLLAEYDAGRVTAALCITYACTSEAWFQPLLGAPQCFLSPRTNYLTPDGKVKEGVTKGSVITYLGRDINKFGVAFSTMGAIKVRYLTFV